MNRQGRFTAETSNDLIGLCEWQKQEINLAIKEADAGDFASNAEVSKTLQKWVTIPRI